MRKLVAFLALVFALVGAHIASAGALPLLGAGYQPTVSGAASVYVKIPSAGGVVEAPVNSTNAALSGYVEIIAAMAVSATSPAASIEYGNTDLSTFPSGSGHGGAVAYLDNSSNQAGLGWSTGGSSFFPTESTTTVIPMANTKIWVRWRVNTTGSTINGVNAHSVSYATSTDGLTYTANGSNLTAGTNVIMNDVPITSNFWFGGGGSPVDVYIYSMQISNAAGVLLNPDFSGHALASTSFTDGAGNVWTLSGGAVFQ